MKIALVHDWIVNMGGAERVLQRLHSLWPSAPIYTLFAKKATIREHFPNAEIRTSGLQRMPGITHIYPSLAALMPAAVEAWDFSEFETVLSSSVIFAKGIVVRPDTRHLCYCYSPARMLWDRAGADERRGILPQVFKHGLRTWDRAAAQRPDQMIAISQTVAGRISKYYRRNSTIIYPPLRQLSLALNHQPSTLNYFLVVARLVPHKQIEIVIEVFNKLQDRLIIVGEGPLRTKLAAQAGQNIDLVGAVSDQKLDQLYQGCQAVIAANEEDFGLTAVEAMAHGKPVLALRRGGATETVLEGTTGEFFDDPIPEALIDGVRRIRANLAHYNPATIRQHAQQWSGDHFDQRIQFLINN